MYLPLYHPVAPRELQRRGNGLLIGSEVPSESSIWGVRRGLKPSGPCGSIPPADDVEQISRRVCDLAIVGDALYSAFRYSLMLLPFYQLIRMAFHSVDKHLLITLDKLQ